MIHDGALGAVRTLGGLKGFILLIIFAKNSITDILQDHKYALVPKKLLNLQHLTSALAKYFFRIAQNPNVFEIQNLENSSNQE